MKNQELIDMLCKTLVDKKFYVDNNTISTIFSNLSPELIEKVMEELNYLED